MKKYLSKAVAVILLGASVSLTAADAPSLPESVTGLITSIQQTVDPQARRVLMNDLKSRLATLDSAQRQTAVERLQTALAESGAQVPTRAQLRHQVALRASEQASAAAQNGAKAGEAAARNGAAAGHTAARYGAQAGMTAAQSGALAGQTAAQQGSQAGAMAAQQGAVAGQTAVQQGALAGQTAAQSGAAAGMAAATGGARVPHMAPAGGSR